MKNKDGYYLSEVFYEDGKPSGYTEDLTGYYETPEELINDLELMLKDTKKSMKDILDEF